jgi:hypothetical protein
MVLSVNTKIDLVRPYVGFYVCLAHMHVSLLSCSAAVLNSSVFAWAGEPRNMNLRLNMASGDEVR